MCLVITVPFEEEDKDASIWFLDHNYHEVMFDMFKRINGMYLSSPTTPDLHVHFFSNSADFVLCSR